VGGIASAVDCFVFPFLFFSFFFFHVCLSSSELRTPFGILFLPYCVSSLEYHDCGQGSLPIYERLEGLLMICLRLSGFKAMMGIVMQGEES
jgi:hypothetical protein